MSVNQESYDYVAHYDPVVAEIVEPLDTIRVENLEEAVTGNGITIDGSVFMADNSTMQLATVQGVAAAPIDFLDDINFDTDSGVKFGTGSKLQEHRGPSTSAVTWTGAIANTSGSFTIEKIGRTVTVTIPPFSGTFASATTILTTAAIDPLFVPYIDVSGFALVKNNGSAATGFVSIEAATGTIVIQPSTGTFTAGTCGLERGATITYISDV